MLFRPVSWRPDLKVWRHWLRPGISWVRLVSGRVTRSRIIQLSVFAKACIQIAKGSGRKGLVLYLKTCNTAVMQSLPGGLLHHSSREIGKVAVARSRDGLPRMIPAFARRLIRSGDTVTIQLWLTFFGMYRVMPCKGKPNFGSITNAGPRLDQSFLREWRSFVTQFLTELGRFTEDPIVSATASVLERPKPFVISSMSADKFEDPRMVRERNRLILAKKRIPWYLRGSPTSFAHRFSSARRWVDGCWVGVRGNPLLRYLNLVPGGAGTTKSLYRCLEEVAEFYNFARSRSRAELPNAHGFGTDTCGRLALLEEAGGKVRVVALADCWTQWALRPLHDWILHKVLKEIPTDGTFDQLRPVKRLLKKVSSDTLIYSYDLSSATDRIPIKIQQLLLAGVFGARFSVAWKLLLVGRPYAISEKVARERGLTSRFLRYAVGQPMGAYSSWAMLALTHHAMVQFCAHRAGIKGWFDLYAVLGDDIVIADSRVAAKYRALCKTLGVEIGLAKSLVSRGKTLEFAKKLFIRGEESSGLPQKFWAAAQSSSGVACALAAWTTRGTLGNFVRALGAGFKVASGASSARWTAMSPRALALCVSLTNPLVGNRFAFRTWPEWLWSESADISRPLNTDLLAQLTPFCTAVHKTVIEPARESLEALQEDLFFMEKVEDTASRLADVACNKALVDAERSIDLASKSLRHLQGLNIKMNLVQISAIITQVWRSADKAGLVPLPSTKAGVRTEIDPYRLKVSDLLRQFKALRRLISVAPPKEVPERGVAENG
jgi:hypothetical protein